MKMSKLNWNKTKLQGRRTLDARYEWSEFRIRDAADRWLSSSQAAERRRLLKLRATDVSSSS
jgi:hypothetical protein